MKVDILIAACAAFLLSAAPASAVTLDFSGHDNDRGDHDSGDGNSSQGGRDEDPNSGDNGFTNKFSSNWSPLDNGDNKKDNDRYGEKGGYSTPDDPSWKNKDPFYGDDHDGHDHDKGDYHKDHHPPPLCATADPGHKGGDQDDKFGHRFSRYFWDICDKGKNGDPGRHHWQGCDPGDPAPLPGAMLMFASGLVFLIGFSCYKRSGRFVR